MAVTRVTRLVLAVRDLEAMIRFYSEAFGCVPAADGVTRLRLGDQIIELAAFDPPGAPWPEDARSNDFTFQHFAIAVSDMAKASLHLLTIPGWTPISVDGPIALPASSGGVTAFKFRDPEGRPLELLEFPHRRAATLFYEINHTAIVVKETERSLAFYAGAFGLTPGKGSRNIGPEQAKLDGLEEPKVRVTPLSAPGAPAPHVELLCYEEPSSHGAAPNGKSEADAIATCTIFATADVETTLRDAIAAGGALIGRNGKTALLRDPDGHDIRLEPIP